MKAAESRYHDFVMLLSKGKARAGKANDDVSPNAVAAEAAGRKTCAKVRRISYEGDSLPAGGASTPSAKSAVNVGQPSSVVMPPVKSFKDWTNSTRNTALQGRLVSLSVGEIVARSSCLV